MATLVLGIAGGALGSAFGPAGAVLGRAAGALAGYTLDQALFGTRRKVEGPRLSDLEVQASTEGAAIPRVYGRARLAGQIIWATDFEEVRESETARRQGRAAGHHDRIQLFRQFRRGALRRADRAHRAHLGGRQAARPGGLQLPRLSGRRDAGGRQPDRRQGGRRRRPIAGRPMWCSSAWRSPISATASRSSPSRCSSPVPGIEDHVRAVNVIPGSTRVRLRHESW